MGGHGKRTFARRYSLDYVDALDVIVADISTVELVSETVEATPPDVAETIGADFGQFWNAAKRSTEKSRRNRTRYFVLICRATEQPSATCGMPIPLQLNLRPPPHHS